MVVNSDLAKIKQWTLRFNNNVSQALSQKHLGLTLDNKLTFDEHLTNVSKP